MDTMNVTNNTTTAAEHDPCVLTDEEIRNSYNLTLRIISVFVLLVVSFLGASFSVASTRIKCLHINPIIINVGKFFGSGVVLATGFIHILPDAMSTLTDPCLPDSWNVYGAYAGLFAMLATLAMQLIEFLAHQRYYSMKHKHAHSVTEQNGKEFSNTVQIDHKTDGSIPIEHVHYNKPKLGQGTQMNGDIDNHGNDEVVEEVHSHIEIPDQHDTVAVDRVQISVLSASLGPCEESAHHHHHGIAFQDDAHHHKISTYLLEFGIAIHSVLIGLTLGTTTESFVALFIALCFHQFFEAMALGAQIANLKTTSIKSIVFMVVFFSFTTPVGIAIGIGIHSGTYNPKSVSSLLVTGILDSLSAGILIYVALVNLISAEMGVNAHGFYSLSGRLKLLYFVALYLGVAAMAVIGRWA